MLDTEYTASANEAWSRLIRNIYGNGNVVRPRGLMCKEILAHTTHVDMTRPITTMRPKLGYKFLVAEAWWILSGRNDVASIKPYSPHIASFSNDGVRFDGSYGPRIVDQLRFVCDTLEADWESRQAVIEIWRPNPRPSKDIPCTLTVQWMIRKQKDIAGAESYKLHCFDTMRSSDAWLGWPYDVFNFSMLSAYIALELRDRATKEPFKINSPILKVLKPGYLHLTAASQHLYVDPGHDGATNIPYSLADVQSLLEKFSSKPDKRLVSTETHYKPLDLDEFESSEEFLKHLSRCKDKAGVDKAWLAEFQG